VCLNKSPVIRPRALRETGSSHPVPAEARALQKLFQTTSESEAVRQAIDETLAYNEALQAARRIQRRGTFARD